jgi:hypothetical protein
MNSLKIPRGYQKPLIEEGDNTMVKGKAINGQTTI